MTIQRLMRGASNLLHRFAREHAPRSNTKRFRSMVVERLEDRIALDASNPFELLDLAPPAGDGSEGFVINAVPLRNSGFFDVQSAGDVNGDGFGDLVLTAMNVELGLNRRGQAYVVLSRGASVPAAIELDALDGTNGFRFVGSADSNIGPFSAAGVGDVNGDGFDDVAIGDPFEHGFWGVTYVVFGRPNGFAPDVIGTDLNGLTGFRINGRESFGFLGETVRAAGDVNGDGAADMAISTRRSQLEGNEGVQAAFVVFGRRTPFPPDVSLKSLNGKTGFRIVGNPNDRAYGLFANEAGDINGDGADDLVVTSPYASTDGTFQGALGVVYVLFGKTGRFRAKVKLATLRGSVGFRVVGQPHEFLGWSAGKAGDVNGDGTDDLVLGAPSLLSNSAPRTYVVFGRTTGFANGVNPSALDGSDGFTVLGPMQNSFGASVDGAGDFNGDGFDDVLIGTANSGQSFLIYGKANGFVPTLDVSSLDGTNGFRLIDETLFSQIGMTVSSAGDVNGDGKDDIFIGGQLPNADASSTGRAYVVLGT